MLFTFDTLWLTRRLVLTASRTPAATHVLIDTDASPIVLLTVTQQQLQSRISDTILCSSIGGGGGR